MRITEIDGPHATIEADGLVQRTNLMLVPQARLGDFVLVHAGFAIAVVDRDEAAERLRLFEEISGLADTYEGESDRPDDPDHPGAPRAGYDPSI